MQNEENEIKIMPFHAVCLISLENMGALISMTCADGLNKTHVFGVLTASLLLTSEVPVEGQESLLSKSAFLLKEAALFFIHLHPLWEKKRRKSNNFFTSNLNP